MNPKRQQIKQQIAATLIISFMALMVFGSVEVADLSAAVNNVTLIQNLVAGTLQLEAPTSKGFNDLTVAVAGNSLANLDQVNVRDFRGTGAGWTLSGTMNNMLTSAAAGGGSNEISNAVIAWAPGTYYALDGGSNTGVSAGTAGFFSAARTLLTATANNGMGNFVMNGTVLNVVYNGYAGQKVGTYQNILTLTVI